MKTGFWGIHRRAVHVDEQTGNDGQAHGHANNGQDTDRVVCHS